MLEANTVLQNRYVITRKLGQGGMGAVYQATDRRFDSTVALKETLVSGEQLRKAFEREARLLNSLRHAALPVVMDYFTESEGVYLVMQFIPGEDLADLLEKNGGPFPASKVVEWSDQLLNALDYLHSYDPPVIHRDIKPQNLKLTPRGEVILLDFGLAKGSVGLSPLTTSSSVLGYTPHYAPFEQIQGSGTDPRSDQYSLAATMYHLITGVKPVDALTRTAAKIGGRPDPLPAPGEVNPDIPASVSDVFVKAMAINQDERYKSADEMRQALREARDGSSITRVGSRSVPATQETGKDMDRTRIGSGQATQLMDTSMGAQPAATRIEAATVVDHKPLASLPAPASVPASTRIEAESRSSSRLPILIIAVLLLAGGAAAVWYFMSNKAAAPPATPSPATAGNGAPETETVAGLPLKTISFDVVTLDDAGKVDRKPGEAKYFTEELGAGVKLDMVRIPEGIFLMGSSGSEVGRFGEEGPQHNVQVSAFYMGRFEVTQAQWRAVAGLPKINRDLNASPSGAEGVNRPVERISWEDAEEFCARLSKKTGKTYRLPSEAEWEYACRAGTTTPYNFGETISPEVANYDGTTVYQNGPTGEYRKSTIPVGSLKAANAFGLYDMHGNVWEWCADPWHASYNGAPSDGSVWQEGADTSKRILRGGSWNRPANNCRSAYRLKDATTTKFDVIGFRVVMVDEKK